MITDDTTEGSPRALPIEAIGQRFAEPVRQHDLAGEARRLRDHEICRREGHTARTLVKNETLRVVLVEMLAGNRLGRHRTRSRISLQVVRGNVSVIVAGTRHDLAAGQLLAVDASLPHDVEAVVDSTFLLTLAREA